MVPSSNVDIINVGNLELSASRWNEVPDLAEYRMIVHIDTGDRVAGLRVRRLLLDSDDFSVTDLCDTETMGVGHLFKQDFRSPSLAAEVLGRTPDAAVR